MAGENPEATQRIQDHQNVSYKAFIPILITTDTAIDAGWLTDVDNLNLENPEEDSQPKLDSEKLKDFINQYQSSEHIIGEFSHNQEEIKAPLEQLRDKSKKHQEGSYKLAVIAHAHITHGKKVTKILHAVVHSIAPKATAGERHADNLHTYLQRNPLIYRATPAQPPERPRNISKASPYRTATILGTIGFGLVGLAGVAVPLALELLSTYYTAGATTIAVGALLIAAATVFAVMRTLMAPENKQASTTTNSMFNQGSDENSINSTCKLLRTIDEKGEESSSKYDSVGFE